MTHKEIKEHLNIPLTTLDSWKKENHNKHLLYLLLINTEAKYVEKKITLDKKNHRIFHILNRNIKESYSWKDIHNAFKKKSYDEGSNKDKSIYSKFFKECDSKDLESLEKVFDVSKRDIKKIYISSPLKKINGISKVWNSRFRIPKEDKAITKEKEYIPTINFEL